LFSEGSASRLETPNFGTTKGFLVRVFPAFEEVAARAAGIGEMRFAIRVTAQAGLAHQSRLVAVTGMTMQAFLVLRRLM